MKIYTKKGDLGKTSLFGGTKLPKSHIRINAYGTVDELNAWVGLIRDQIENEDLRDQLKEIQNRLFDIGSSLASDPEKNPISSNLKPDDISGMEDWIDQQTSELKPLRNFILPGGHTLVSQTHLARTVARRAERMIVDLSLHSEVEARIIKYMNRLSDYLFTLSRTLSKQLEVDEVIWKARK
jgi:cob(I)alamin adenosyltransferase